MCLCSSLINTLTTLLFGPFSFVTRFRGRIYLTPHCVPGGTLVAKLCASREPMDCSPPDSAVHRILQEEYWSGLPFPSRGDLSHPGVEPGSPALQADSLPTESPGKIQGPHLSEPPLCAHREHIGG